MPSVLSSVPSAAMPRCCVLGCNSRYTPDTTVRFYRIPGGKRQFHINRRRLWIEAIQRANGSGEIRTEDRICGVHFITGEASTDPDRPNFVPTLFTCDARQAPRKRRKWTLSRRKKHRKNEVLNEGATSEDKETHKSPSQPASESPMEHQSLRFSVSKEEETDDKMTYNKHRSETESKTEPETMKPSLNPIPSTPKPIESVVKLNKMNPFVLLKRLVLPQVAYQGDLSNQTFTSASGEEQCEESDVSQNGLPDSHSVNRDQAPFPCNMCDRTFKTSHYLKRHKLLHVRDVRKCLRCGALFCRRHNHVLFHTRPERQLESEESSSSSEDDCPDNRVIKAKEKTSKGPEMPGRALSTQTDTPPDSPNSPVLNTSSPTDVRKPLLVSVKPAALPSPPSPIIELPNNQGMVFQIKPLLCDVSPASIPSDLPQPPKLPSSLKIFSAQHLTSALLDVKRNYEYILSKPSGEFVKIKEEPGGPVQIFPFEPPVVEVKLEKIAYDLEVVI